MNKIEKDLVSIVVPVYNAEKYIEQCINSISNQIYRNIEIVVVDDGSTDNSLSLIKELQLNDNRIIIVEQKNQGVSCARNNGLKNSKGKYVIFIDADDYISNDFVDYMYMLISKYDSDFAFSIENYWEENEKQTSNVFEKEIDSNKAVGLLLSPDVTVGCWNKIYKKSFIANNNIYFRNDLFYGEGLNFIIRTASLSNNIIVGNKKVYYYRKNNIMSATSSFNFKKYINGEKSLFIIRDLIDMNNDFVKSMFLLHISTFYVGAISKLIENKCVNDNIYYYKTWRKNIRKSLINIIVSKYISLYRKLIIVVGYFFPHLISRMNSIKDKRKIDKSIN